MIRAERLRVLVTLAQEGTLTRTAEVLHYGQPTVTHHLQRLQAEVGATLVTHVGRGLRLTAEGRLLADRGSAILAALDQAEREVRSMVALEHGVLRLATFPSATPTLVPPILDALANRAPGLSVELSQAEPPEAAAQLATDRIDAALVFDYPDARLDPGLALAKVGEDTLHLITPRSWTKRRAGRLADYSDERWLAGCERCRGHLLAACAEAGFTPRIGYSSDDYLAVQSLVAAGQGVTLLPGLALRAFRHPEVRATQLPGQRRSVYLAMLSEPRTPAMQLLRDVVVSSASGERAGGVENVLQVLEGAHQ